MKTKSIHSLSLLIATTALLATPALAYKVRTISQSDASVVYEIAMTADEQAFVDEENMSILVARLQDSRCPTDRHCFWGGNVKLSATIAHDGEMQSPIMLSLQSGKAIEQQKILEQFWISLDDVGVKSVDNQSPWIHLRLVKRLEPHL